MVAGEGGLIHWLRENSWFLSALALIVSVVALSYARTETRRIRQGDIKRDEFNNRIRVPIENAVSQLEDEGQNLRAMRHSHRPLMDLRKELSERGAALAERYDRLASALAKADRSPITEGDDWASVAEPFWERLLEALGAATDSSAQLEDLHSHVDLACSALDELVNAVEQRVDNEVQTHLNV